MGVDANNFSRCSIGFIHSGYLQVELWQDALVGGNDLFWELSLDPRALIDLRQSAVHGVWPRSGKGNIIRDAGENGFARIVNERDGRPEDDLPAYRTPVHGHRVVRPQDVVFASYFD